MNTDRIIELIDQEPGFRGTNVMEMAESIGVDLETGQGVLTYKVYVTSYLFGQKYVLGFMLNQEAFDDPNSPEFLASRYIEKANSDSLELNQGNSESDSIH